MDNQNEIKKKKCVGICVGGSCYNAGSEVIMKKVEEHYNVIAGETNNTIDVDFVGCLGHCDFGVNIEVDSEVFTGVTKDNVINAIETGINPNANVLQNKNNLDDILEKELSEI